MRLIHSKTHWNFFFFILPGLWSSCQRKICSQVQEKGSQFCWQRWKAQETSGSWGSEGKSCSNIGPCVFHDPRIEELTNEKRSYWNTELTEYYGPDCYLTKIPFSEKEDCLCEKNLQDHLYFTSQTHSSPFRTMRAHWSGHKTCHMTSAHQVIFAILQIQ